jgi:hypothetical protein
MTKAITNRIEEINALLPSINNLDEIVGTYANSTMWSYIRINSPITYKNNMVWIDSDKTSNDYPFEKRYTISNEWQLDELKYDLNLILRTFKKALK